MLGVYPAKTAILVVSVLAAPIAWGAEDGCGPADSRVAALSEREDATRRVAVLDATGRVAVPADPASVFDRLVSRYRDFSTYEDSVVVEQITARDGQRAQREETHIRCEITESGDLEVTTPARQMRGEVGLNALLDRGAGDASRLRYRLWLAPHLALRFRQDPLEEFRPGIDEGFTPVAAEQVTFNDQQLLRLELRSGDGLSDDFRARFELFIDPVTLLITRVRGEQLLPDGANLLTDFTITPRHVVTSDGRSLLAGVTVGAAT